MAKLFVTRRFYRFNSTAFPYVRYGTEIAAAKGTMAAMKSAAVRHRKSAGVPVAWREAGYAALRANAADTCDDRVSEDIFDTEDEREQVDRIVHGTMYGLNSAHAT
jgi:hypothetical protein